MHAAAKRVTMKSRLFLKIFASYIVLIILVMAVLDFLHTPQIRETLTKSISEKMIGHGKIITLMTDKEIHSRISELAEFSDSRVTLIDPSGVLRPIPTPMKRPWTIISTVRNCRKPD